MPISISLFKNKSFRCPNRAEHPGLNRDFLERCYKLFYNPDLMFLKTGSFGVIFPNAGELAVTKLKLNFYFFI